MVSSLEPEQGRVDYWHPKGGHHDLNQGVKLPCLNSQTYYSHSAHIFLFTPLVLASHLALHEQVINLFFMNEHLAFKAQVRKSKNKIHVDKKHGPAGIKRQGQEGYTCRLMVYARLTHLLTDTLWIFKNV